MRLHIILLSLFIFSCDEEPKDIKFQDYLDLTAVKEYLPSSYFNEAKLIFTNIEGEELELLTNSNESETDKIHNGSNYKTEHFEVNIFDPNDSEFLIVLIGNANYSNSGEILKSITGLLTPLSSLGSTWNSIAFESGEPVISILSDFHKLITLNNRDYYDVFKKIGKQGNVPYDAYSELNINSEFGVIAFRDVNNNLWTLDRIEE